MAVRQYATFAVGDLCLGIEVERVQEVLAEQAVVAMPLAPPGVRGLVNRRGDIIAVLDARTLLGLERGAEAAAGAHVVIEHGGETVSLVVDGERDVIEVDPAHSHPVPETVDPALRRMLAAVVELEDGTFMLALRGQAAA